jgi:hypothetical protein
MLKGEIAKVRSGAGKVLLAIRSGSKTHEPKASEEAIPPPEEKKAA